MMLFILAYVPNQDGPEVNIVLATNDPKEILSTAVAFSAGHCGYKEFADGDRIEILKIEGSVVYPKRLYEDGAHPAHPIVWKSVYSLGSWQRPYFAKEFEPFWNEQIYKGAFSLRPKKKADR